MAKTITKESDYISNSEMRSNGNSYRVLEQFRIRHLVVEAGFILRERIDSFYQVYTPDGYKHFFSIASRHVDQIKKENCI